MKDEMIPAFPIAEGLKLSKAEFFDVCQQRDVRTAQDQRGGVLVFYEDIVRCFPEIEEEADYWRSMSKDGRAVVVNYTFWTDLETARSRRAERAAAGLSGWGRP